MNVKRNNINCPYEHYYSHQAGSGVGVIYKGTPYQRGHGIGSFLGGLFRSVLPLLSSGAKAVGKQMLNTGVGLLTDMVNAQPMKESFKNRFKEASGNLKRKADEKIDSLMSGSGYKMRGRSNKLLLQSKNLNGRVAKRKRINNKKIKDIFSS